MRRGVATLLGTRPACDVDTSVSGRDEAFGFGHADVANVRLSRLLPAYTERLPYQVDADRGNWTLYVGRRNQVPADSRFRVGPPLASASCRSCL